MRMRWKALIALAVVVAAVLVAAVLINQPAASDASKDTTTDGLTATGKFGFPVSSIKVGDGGTRTAVDGKTRIGYSGDCTSAAQAAANYLPLGLDFNPKTWDAQKKTLQDRSLPETVPSDWLAAQDQAASNKDAQNAGFDGGWWLRNDVKAGGLYRIVSCEDKKSALIQVFYGRVSAQTTTAPRAIYSTVPVELTWDGDWKLTNFFRRPGDTTVKKQLKDSGPYGQGFDGGDGTPQVLAAGDMDRLFQGKSREGWIEYANATR